MCIGFIKLGKSSDRYKLILLNNRDEDLNRETMKLHWDEEKNILGGTDMFDKCQGTWLAINKHGKIGMLLSITQPKNEKSDNAPSRGQICHQYLNSENSSEFLENLVESSQRFNGFQFLGIEQNSESGEYEEIRSVANKYVESVEIRRDSEAIQVYSNSPPNIPFKKVVAGKIEFEKCLEDSENMEKSEIFEALIKHVATNKERHLPDDQIALQTGRMQLLYAPISAIFVEYPTYTVQYGTRCHTVMIVDKNDRVTVFERRRENGEWLDEIEEFEIAKS